MATLTERETKLEVGQITAQLFAEYENGKCRDIYATIDCDGWVVTWDQVRHHQGQIILWQDGKFTSDWKVAVNILDSDFMLQLRKEIDKLTENR